MNVIPKHWGGMEGSKQGCESSDWLCSLEIPGRGGRGLERVESVRTRRVAAGEAGSDEAFCQRVKLGPEPV